MDLCWFDWRISGGPVFNCDRKHSYNHRRCCCEVQLWSTHPPLRPHTEGQCGLRDVLGINSLTGKWPVFFFLVLLIITCVHDVQSWEVESDRVRQKLLSLIGRIGREARSETTTGKVRRGPSSAACEVSLLQSESSCNCARLFRCWRCCGSWLTSPPCQPV